MKISKNFNPSSIQESCGNHDFKDDLAIHLAFLNGCTERQGPFFKSLSQHKIYSRHKH